jgi:hypothetical protein
MLEFKDYQKHVSSQGVEEEQAEAMFALLYEAMKGTQITQDFMVLEVAPELLAIVRSVCGLWVCVRFVPGLLMPSTMQHSSCPLCCPLQ